MSTSLFKYFLPSSDISNDEERTITSSADTLIDLQYQEFLPEVHDTWIFIQKISSETARFREIYERFRYERSEDQQRAFFDQLKTLDEKIYNLSFTIHQRIQSLEKIVQPAVADYRQSILHNQQMDSYTPAYIRIVQNQLNSLKTSFKRIIITHNADSIDYQNDLKQSMEQSRAILHSYQQASPRAMNQIQISVNPDEEKEINLIVIASEEQIQLQLAEEKQIADLEERLESIRMLKDRVRHMNEMSMALYFSVQGQNELTDNIWLNTSAGSDYIAQSVDEFRLVKDFKQSKMNLWMKLICITCSFLLILLFLLTLILILNQK